MLLDLHILINTIHSPSIINNSASASWLPVCLPKFNSAAFVNAYVTFLKREDSSPISRDASSQQDIAPVASNDRGGNGADDSSTTTKADLSAHMGLVCVSGSADLEAVRTWCDIAAKARHFFCSCDSDLIERFPTQKMQQDRLLDAISNWIQGGQSEYVVSDLRVPGLRHFVYKSRAHIQVTMPVFEEPYENLDDRRRLITLYQSLYDAIHAKSGQGSTLKLQYMRLQNECVMGWVSLLHFFARTLDNNLLFFAPRLPNLSNYTWLFLLICPRARW